MAIAELRIGGDRWKLVVVDRTPQDTARWRCSCLGDTCRCSILPVKMAALCRRGRRISARTKPEFTILELFDGCDWEKLVVVSKGLQVQQ